MKNELLLLGSVFVIYGAVLVAYRLFGKIGMYIMTVIATILANIEVLSDEELYRWKLENLDKVTQSISCIFPKNVHVETIQKTVANMDNIIGIKLTDAYNGPQIDTSSISLTFEISALSNENIKNVKKLFTGFGGIIR